MNTTVSQQPIGLAQLERQLLLELSRLELPAKPWVPLHHYNNQPVLDVAIIGGGMAGLTAAAALIHLGINVQVFDRAPKGYEGPWATTARMETLRSPKQLTGPALGIPSLTFRAWFEAQFGADKWAQLDKIPRLQWMDYLRWYRKVLNLPVQNDHEVLEVSLVQPNLVALRIKHLDQEKMVYARRLILATGRDGLGGPSVPDFANHLPSHLWAHSSDPFDYHTLKNKKVGVIGAGASAMDSAATALECGAKSVDMLIRRSTIPSVNKGKGAGNPGIMHGFYSLPDQWKWRIRHYINEQQVPPPHNSTLRVSRHQNAYFNVGCTIERVELQGEQLAVHTNLGVFELDFLIFATGFKIDWYLRPEYANFAPYVRTWADRFQPQPGQEDPELSACPDLGENFEFKVKDQAPIGDLSHIYCFSYPAVATHGNVSGDIPAISEGAQALARGIAGSLYQEDIDYFYQELESFSEPELEGNEWQPAPPPSERVG